MIGILRSNETSERGTALPVLREKEKEGQKWERSGDTILITARVPEMSG